MLTPNIQGQIKYKIHNTLSSCRKPTFVNTHIFSYHRYTYIHIERRLLFKLIWKAAFVWVTPYLVQLTFSLEACSWKNGDLVFQRWSFFSILEACMGIDDPYVKKPRWRRNWNAISKMIKDDLAEGMVTRKLCVWRFWTSFWPRFRPRFFQGIMNRNVPTRLESTWLYRLESTKRAKLKTAKQHQPSQKSKSLTCCYLLPRFWVTPYLVPIGTVDLKKKCFHPQAIPFFSK